MSTADRTDRTTSTDGTVRTDSTDPAQIEDDIARHREELAQTVDQLAGRLDVKAQARYRVDSMKAQARQRVDGIREQARSADRNDLLGAAAPVLAVLAGIALLAGVRRRRR